DMSACAVLRSLAELRKSESEPSARSISRSHLTAAQSGFNKVVNSLRPSQNSMGLMQSRSRGHQLRLSHQQDLPSREAVFDWRKIRSIRRGSQRTASTRRTVGPRV